MTSRATPTEAQLRRDLCEAGRRMHRQGFAAGSDGNLSARLNREQILITPSGFSKGYLEPDQLVVIDMQGQLVPSFHPARRHLRASSERNMHLEAYHQRPDVMAVIHAHPPLGIACTVAGVRLDSCALPEVVFHLGRIPTAPYATPGTPEGADAVRDLVTHHDAMLLDRHGSLSLGGDIFQALMRLEWIEQAAKIMLAAVAATGAPVTDLPAPAVARLQQLRRAALESIGRAASADGSACTPTAG
jgi:L-fuculose-phosphate aldolase